jgi:hypothetical protein
LANITSQTDSNHLQNVNVTTVYKRLEYLETEMKNVPTNANLESITSSLADIVTVKNSTDLSWSYIDRKRLSYPLWT